MKHHKLEMVLPPTEAPPGLEEYLDPSVKGVDDHTSLPTGAHARQALAHAVAEIMACGGNPYTTPYVVDLECSERFRPRRFVPNKVPCLTHSRKQGLWITSRGRRMTAAECFRIQGISRRATQGLPATFLRACAGNAMSVRIAAMLLESALDLMVCFA